MEILYSGHILNVKNFVYGRYLIRSHLVSHIYTVQLVCRGKTTCQGSHLFYHVNNADAMSSCYKIQGH